MIEELSKHVLAICILAVIIGLVKIILPDKRFSNQMSFLTAGIFILVLFDIFGSVNFENGIDFTFEGVPIVDYKDVYKSETQKTLSKSAIEKIEKLLISENIKFHKVNVDMNISADNCITISKVQLVLKNNCSEEEIARGVDILKNKLGNDITITYILEQ